MIAKEMLAFRYIEDVAKSHKDAVFSAFCVGYSIMERKNAELAAALVSCNSAAVAAKNRTTNGGGVTQAIQALDGIAETSKNALENQL